MLPAARPFAIFFASNWNRGGIATCSAQLNVFNWIIPQNISQGGGWLWSKKTNTDKKQLGAGTGQSVEGQRSWEENAGYGIDGVHNDGMQGGGMGNWLMSKEEFSMLTDPWALTDPDEVHPNDFSIAPMLVWPGKLPGVDIYNPLLDRTGHYYADYASSALGEAHKWHKDKAISQFLDYTSQVDTVGDHLHSVPVEWAREKTRSRSDGYASGYEDSRQQSANRPNHFPPSWGPKN